MRRHWWKRSGRALFVLMTLGLLASCVGESAVGERGALSAAEIDDAYDALAGVWVSEVQLDGPTVVAYRFVPGAMSACVAGAAPQRAAVLPISSGVVEVASGALATAGPQPWVELAVAHAPRGSGAPTLNATRVRFVDSDTFWVEHHGDVVFRRAEGQDQGALVRACSSGAATGGER